MAAWRGRARTLAAAGGGNRCRRGRQTPKCGAHPSRQHRASPDDRRSHRCGNRAEHRAHWCARAGAGPCARIGSDRLAAELSNRPTPPDVPTPPSRSAASRVNAPTLAPVEPSPSRQTVHNLQELKRQLEAALSRSPASQGRPPVTDPPQPEGEPAELAGKKASDIL
jgi:hypothetical protein